MTNANELASGIDGPAEVKKPSWKKIAIGVAVGIAAVHGWLVLQYGTPAPCAAAVERTTGIFTARMFEDMDAQLAGNPFGGLAKALAPGMINSMKPMFTTTMREKGPLTCYAAAFGAYDEYFANRMDEYAKR